MHGTAHLLAFAVFPLDFLQTHPPATVIDT